MIDFPEAFKERVLSEENLGQPLLNSLNETSPTSIRLNPNKAYNHEFNGEEIPWCRDALRLNERPKFTFDPAFHAGAYYPQEAGSMMLDLVLTQLNFPESPIILDLCAAPGGKSTLISRITEGKGLLVSNEINHARAQILKENCTKWGINDVLVTNNDPREFSKISGLFDAVFVDAPCSGEGMFRRLPESRKEWSEDNVQLCSARQKRIVHDVWSSIKEGGFLVYSTCTLNPDENEQNIEHFRKELHAEIVDIEVPDGVQRDALGLGNYCFPHHLKTEGFYFAVLRKSTAENQVKLKVKKSELKIIHHSALHEWTDSDGRLCLDWRDNVLQISQRNEELLKFLQQQLRIVKMGTDLGQLSRKGLIPHADLILSHHLTYAQRTGLSLDSAIEFLSGHPPVLPNSTPKGWCVVTYNDLPLGLVKNLGNRVNNYWPSAWRIRSQNH